MWFVAIQGVKRKQDLAGLAPKRCFISAEAIDRVVGRIGETQKATRELSGRIDIRFDGFRHGARHGFCSIRDTVRCRIAMVGVCGRAPADQTRLFGHEFDVLLIPEPARLGRRPRTCTYSCQIPLGPTFSGDQPFDRGVLRIDRADANAVTALAFPPVPHVRHVRAKVISAKH